MKAVLLYEYGPAENLRYEETGNPIYGDNEVLVRVKATSINPIHFKRRSRAGGKIILVPWKRLLSAHNCNGSTRTRRASLLI